MAKTYCFPITFNGMITEIAFRSEQMAKLYCEGVPGRSYHKSELVPKQKKETSVKLFDVEDDAVKLFNHISSIFDKDTIDTLSEKGRSDWIDTIRKLNTIDRHPFKTIYNVILWWRKDDFWSSTKQSILCLRQLNKEKMKYFIVFKNKMENERKFAGNSKDNQIAKSANETADFIASRLGN